MKRLILAAVPVLIFCLGFSSGPKEPKTKTSGDELVQIQTNVISGKSELEQPDVVSFKLLLSEEKPGTNKIVGLRGFYQGHEIDDRIDLRNPVTAKSEISVFKRLSPGADIYIRDLVKLSLTQMVGEAAVLIVDYKRFPGPDIRQNRMRETFSIQMIEGKYRLIYNGNRQVPILRMNSVNPITPGSRHVDALDLLF